MPADRSSLALRRPGLFSALVTVVFVVLLVVVAVATGAVGENAVGEGVGAFGRLLIAAGALAWLARLGWRRELAGIGTVRSWFLVLPALVYVLLVYPPLFTGSYALPAAGAALMLAVAANGFAAGVMEELVFRGLVLGALVRRWGSHGRGLWKALLVSSLLFSAPHALNVLAGADPLRTGAQLVWAVLLGLVFGALAVAGRTVWPVAVLHGVANAVLHVQRIGYDGALEPTTAVLMALAPVPLVVYGMWALRRTADVPAV